MNEQDKNHEISIADLEAPNADKIKGGQEAAFENGQEEESARMLSTVSVKIRKPGK